MASFMDDPILRRHLTVTEPRQNAGAPFNFGRFQEPERPYTWFQPSTSSFGGNPLRVPGLGMWRARTAEAQGSAASSSSRPWAFRGAQERQTLKRQSAGTPAQPAQASQSAQKRRLSPVKAAPSPVRAAQGRSSPVKIAPSPVRAQGRSSPVNAAPSPKVEECAPSPGSPTDEEFFSCEEGDLDDPMGLSPIKTNHVSFQMPTQSFTAAVRRKRVRICCFQTPRPFSYKRSRMSISMSRKKTPRRRLSLEGTPMPKKSRDVSSMYRRIWPFGSGTPDGKRPRTTDGTDPMVPPLKRQKTTDSDFDGKVTGKRRRASNVSVNVNERRPKRVRVSENEPNTRRTSYDKPRRSLYRRSRRFSFARAQFPGVKTEDGCPTKDDTMHQSASTESAEVRHPQASTKPTADHSSGTPEKRPKNTDGDETTVNTPAASKEPSAEAAPSPGEAKAPSEKEAQPDAGTCEAEREARDFKPRRMSYYRRSRRCSMASRAEESGRMSYGKRRRSSSMGSQRGMKTSRKEILTVREMKAKLSAMGIPTRGLEKHELLDLLRKSPYLKMRRRSLHEVSREMSPTQRRMDQIKERRDEVFRILGAKCPWAILKLSPTVRRNADCEKLIKKQFRSLSKLCHPDKAPSQLRTEATQAFQMMEKAAQDARQQAANKEFFR